MMAMVVASTISRMVLAQSFSPAIPTQPVMDVLVRVIGASSASIFDLKLDPSMAQGFSLHNTQENAKDKLITVTASALPELAYGAAYYLRTYADMQVNDDNVRALLI